MDFATFVPKKDCQLELHDLGPSCVALHTSKLYRSTRARVTKFTFFGRMTVYIFFLCWNAMVMLWWCYGVLLHRRLNVAMLHSRGVWIDLVFWARKLALDWLVCGIALGPTSFTLTRLNLKRAHGALVDSHFENGSKGDKRSAAKFAVTLRLLAIEPNDAPASCLLGSDCVECTMMSTPSLLSSQLGLAYQVQKRFSEDTESSE